jgi:hypothetical protein
MLKAKWNPSTGKKIYDQTTGKVQTVVTNCAIFGENSANTPRAYIVNIANVVSCNTGVLPVIQEAVPNGTYTLDSYYSILSGSQCIWRKLYYYPRPGGLDVYTIIISIDFDNNSEPHFMRAMIWIDSRFIFEKRIYDFDAMKYSGVFNNCASTIEDCGFTCYPGWALMGGYAGTISFQAVM